MSAGLLTRNNRNTDPEWLPEELTKAERISAGGQGEIWRARSLKTGRPVAVKRFFNANGDAFYRESTALLSIRSRHVPSIETLLDSTDGTRLIVMEYCSGGSLRASLNSGVTFEAKDAALVAWHVCLALSSIHAVKLVHADVKPENILRRSRTLNNEWVLGDLGISVSSNNDRIQRAMTPAYAAPEQIGGRPTRESDVFSLAMCVIELLTGTKPERGSLLVDLDQVPVSWREWFRAALSHEPEDRPSASASARFWRAAYHTARLRDHLADWEFGVASNELIETEGGTF